MQTTSWKEELAGILQEYRDAEASIEDTVFKLRCAVHDLTCWIERHPRLKAISELNGIATDLHRAISSLDYDDGL
jgi:hypothetical protein